jgi:O-succinylbenzoate synthase
LPGDVSASNRWYTTDLTEPFVLDPSDGTIAVPTAPVAPVDEVLDERTVSRERLERPRR